MGEEHRQTPQRTCRGFTKEFERDAVELVRSSGRAGVRWASRSARVQGGSRGGRRPAPSRRAGGLPAGGISSRVKSRHAIAVTRGEVLALRCGERDKGVSLRGAPVRGSRH
jgi:hypothetical protein